MRMRGKLPIYSYRDMWNLDHTLDILIYHALVKFKKTMEDPNELAGFPIECRNMKHWLLILDAMIFAFNPKFYEDRTHGYMLPKEKQKELDRKVERGRKLFIEYYESLWT